MEREDGAQQENPKTGQTQTKDKRRLNDDQDKETWDWMTTEEDHADDQQHWREQMGYGPKKRQRTILEYMGMPQQENGDSSKAERRKAEITDPPEQKEKHQAQPHPEKDKSAMDEEMDRREVQVNTPQTATEIEHKREDI